MTTLATVTLPAASTPRASILILAYRNCGLLARCLEALQSHVPPGLAEVIVLLNGAEPEVDMFVRRRVHGARILVSEANLGFAGGCNRAARVARGEYLVLLNNDTEVETGWLESLIATADVHPEAGVVGSRILFPDGTLQEAGCVLWNDGSTLAVGCHSTAVAQAFLYRRTVDYCSGCSMLVRRSFWHALEGMDDEYYPAYYEDADFCLRVRLAAGQVWYEPQSRVRHIGGASTREAFRRFVSTRSRRRFVEKWRDRLGDYHDPRPASPASVRKAVLRARGLARTVLVIDDKVPEHDSAQFVWLRQLTGEAAVTFFASRERPPDPRYLGDFGIETLYEPIGEHLSRADIAYDAIDVKSADDWGRHASGLQRFQAHTLLDCRP